MVLFVIFATALSFVIVKATGYDYSFIVIAFVLAIFSSVGSFFFADKVVLATTHAKLIKKSDHPELYRIVENLSIGSGLPMPKTYIIEDISPNAFATGRDPQHASMAVTTGLLDKLSKIELEGVIAHELSHIKNLDTRLLAITAVLVGFIAILADMFTRHIFWGNLRGRDRGGRNQMIFIVIGIVLAIVAPICASLIQLAVSRKREFLADASGALLTRYPDGLASALEKISADPHSLKNVNDATSHLFIVTPIKGKSITNWLSRLYSTHPPIEERIKILRSM